MTSNANTDKTSIVKDIINISGLNTLRGENNEKFGPRFPDISTIYDKETAAKLQLPLEVFELQLDQKFDCC